MPIISKLEKSFNLHKSTDLAKKQSAYMRCLFPFFGFSKQTRALVQKPILKTLSLKDEPSLKKLLINLWEKDERDFQYVALDIANNFKKYSSPQILSTYEFMIRKKSWWDTVDAIAANLVGFLLLKYPDLLPKMDEWIKDENIWIRRSALIFQLKWKDKTDYARLFEYCSITMEEKDFFIKKAIGWALRQYSKKNPKLVKEFIQKNKNSLSSLSIKEASKYL